MKILPAFPVAVMLFVAGAVLPVAARADDQSNAVARDFPEASASVMDKLEALHAKYGVSALLVAIAKGDGEPVLGAAGTSMSGVPASTDMHYRMGAMAIASLTTILLQLVDENVVSLDDTIDNWLPEYPDADKVTLRMLADSSSGYADYISAPQFTDAFYEDVFYEWSDRELLDVAFEQGMQFEPGTDFLYAHTNFIVLGQALGAATGKPYETLLQDRIVDRLDLMQTKIWTTAELPDPPLHAFTTERGILEDSTYWSPSWTSYTGSLNGDLADTAKLMRAVATGETISDESLAEMKAETNVGFGPMTPDRYFGLGMEFVAPWIQKTFAFGGYGGTAGYLASEDVTLVVVITHGAKSDIDTNPSAPIFKEISSMLGY
ncbi:serine hydrolase domain-containing protein [Microbaculum marinum]|uniref:Serine hydrolase domain-containing protein n=1 Tax=Microbaculum marinum TaxID=1764581 RepID=A0AAW9RV24_9HYPH